MTSVLSNGHRRPATCCLEGYWYKNGRRPGVDRCSPTWSCRQDSSCSFHRQQPTDARRNTDDRLLGPDKHCFERVTFPDIRLDGILLFASQLMHSFVSFLDRCTRLPPHCFLVHLSFELHLAPKLSRDSQGKLLVLFLRATERNEIVGHENVSILHCRVLKFLDRRGKQNWIIVPGNLME